MGQFSCLAFYLTLIQSTLLPSVQQAEHCTDLSVKHFTCAELTSAVNDFCICTRATCKNNSLHVVYWQLTVFINVPYEMIIEILMRSSIMIYSTWSLRSGIMIYSTWSLRSGIMIYCTWSLRSGIMIYSTWSLRSGIMIYSTWSLRSGIRIYSTWSLRSGITIYSTWSLRFSIMIYTTWSLRSGIMIYSTWSSHRHVMYITLHADTCTYHVCIFLCLDITYLTS